MDRIDRVDSSTPPLGQTGNAIRNPISRTDLQDKAHAGRLRVLPFHGLRTISNAINCLFDPDDHPWQWVVQVRVYGRANPAPTRQRRGPALVEDGTLPEIGRLLASV